jgi:large subunit ribosomal protein L35Ae
MSTEQKKTRPLKKSKQGLEKITKPAKKLSTPFKALKLYSNAIVTGYSRNRIKQKVDTSLMKIEGVKTRHDAHWYLGKKVAYSWKNPATKTHKSENKVIWGKITKIHGNSGSVQAKFRTNLPPKAIGNLTKVFLYPSSI